MFLVKLHASMRYPYLMRYGADDKEGFEYGELQSRIEAHNVTVNV